MNKDIKWEIAREVIHLAYDYLENQPTQWDYLSNISLEDLESLSDYCTLQKYTKLPNVENALSWNEINQLIKLELNYRNND